MIEATNGRRHGGKDAGGGGSLRDVRSSSFLLREGGYLSDAGRCLRCCYGVIPCDMRLLYESLTDDDK